MKQFIAGLACGVAATALVWFGLQHLSGAIFGGTCKARAADLRSLTTALEGYRSAYGTYPRGMTIEELARALEPKYMQSIPQQGLDYFSDGATYALFSRVPGDGPAESECCFELRDRQFVMWPASLGQEAPTGK